MATWNSTPNVPNTGGTFNFPQNTTDDDIVYTINYTDDSGCTASTTYTVPSCSCGRYKFFDLGTEVAASGGTQALCYSTVKESALVFDAAKSTSWITYTRTQSGKEYQSYICTVSPNENSSYRIGDAVFTSRDGCEFTATVTQKGAIDCSVYGFVDQHYQLSANSGNGVVALSSVSAGTLTFSRSKSSNWISFVSVQGGGMINAYVCSIEANNTGVERVGYAVFSSLDGCEFSGTVTQSSEAPVQKVEYRVVFAENNNPNVENIADLRFAFTNGSDEHSYDTTGKPSGGFRVGTEAKLYADAGYTYNRVITLAVNNGTPRPPSDLTVTFDNASKTITVKYTYTGKI
jgi:hypothetical protein